MCTAICSDRVISFFRTIFSDSVAVGAMSVLRRTHDIRQDQALLGRMEEAMGQTVKRMDDTSDVF